MDITSLLGIVIGIGLILLGMFMEGGTLTDVTQITAALIVFGGTIGAVIVCFPLADLIGALKALGIVFGPDKSNNKQIIKEIVGFATKARKEGVIALEKEAKNTSDPLIKLGLEAVSDGADPTLVRDLLETRLGQMEEERARYAKVWESTGAISPTVGIIGAVMGLIQVMKNLSDPSALGAGIAVAFVATIYGLIFANIFCIPFSSKIKFKSKAEFVSKEMAIEGILSIQAGESPALIERKLQAFILDQEDGDKVSPKSAEANA